MATFSARRQTARSDDGVAAWFLDETHLDRKRQMLLTVALIAIGLGLVWVVVFSTNGTSNVFLHAMYVPIIAAGLTLGLGGGVVTALAAAILVGPLMPLDVERGVAQPVANMAYRAAFFMLIAVTTSGFAAVSRRRLNQLSESRAHVSDLLARNLRLFANLVSKRDEQTGGHCERVAQNAVTLGRAIGLGPDAEHTLYWGGVLHDLGKLGVPEAILRKPGRLTTEEFDIIREHPGFGERLLLDISPDFSAIAAAVRSHHERWDGGGYPDGLAGDEIPIVGRILAVVDVYEAITSVRPYRGPMEPNEARQVIADGSGTHFDPALVEAFLNLERQGRITRELAPEPMAKELDVDAGTVRERQAFVN